MPPSASDAVGSPDESGSRTSETLQSVIEWPRLTNPSNGWILRENSSSVSYVGWLDRSEDGAPRIEIPNHDRIGTFSPAPTKTLVSKFTAVLADSSISRTFS